MLLIELLTGLAVIYIGAALIFMMLVSLPFAIAGAIVDAAGRRVDRRPDRRLRWSVPVDDIARALVAEQAVSLLVSFTGRLRSRRLEFLFVPLREVRDLTARNPGSGAARWHAFCATTGRGSVTALPFSGRNLAVNLVGAGPDSQPAAEPPDVDRPPPDLVGRVMH